VALGTIYRYFPSKDALLAAAMVEWMEDLERRVTTRAPQGETTSERVFDVLRRAVATMERQPKLAEAVITALTSDDREAGGASVATTDVMQRVMLTAFPEGTDPDVEAAIAKVLGHVWFSCLVAWTNGVGDLAWVGAELETACHLLCDHLG
jgi:AcrR family transcriptional regulator